jgi:hypothetical protein
MKRPQPDIGNVLRNEFIGNVSTIRKLKRLWGTTYVGGVEVLNARQYHWPESSRSENFEKLYKTIGIHKDVTEADYEGLRSAWIYFNKNKAADLLVDFEDFVSDNLNILWWDPADGERPEGLTLTTSIVINAKAIKASDQATVDSLINVDMTVEQAKQAILDNYEQFWDLCSISQEGVGVINKGSITDPVNKTVTPDEDDLTPDDPWLSTIARYALRDNGIACTIKDVSIGTMSARDRPFMTSYYTTYVVEIEIPYNAFTPGELFVQSIANDLSFDYDRKSKSNGNTTKQLVQGLDSSELEDDDNLVTRPYISWESQSIEADSIYSSLWIKEGKTYYLKAEPFHDPRSYGLNYKKLANYILPLLDTGYKKKKVPFWKKALAVVIFIIAVILAPVTGGNSLLLVKVSLAILFASLVLTLFTLVLAVTGQHEWASAFMEAQKFLEPLVMVATIIVIVTGLGSAYDAAKTAAEAAAKEGAKAGIVEIITELVTNLIESLVDSIIKGATDVFAGNLATSAALQFTGKLLKLLTLPFNLKLESLNNRNKDLAAEYAELTKESNQEYDALQGFMNVYAKPATADWSMYAATFDQPYERGGGPLAMGNIQRTTKQALRKADYTDPAFAGILII